MAAAQEAPTVVIVGAGIIGACSAYFVALRGVKSTVIERLDVACGASGRAGGFLARKWCTGLGYGSFAEKSYELHQQIARDIGPERIGYRPVKTSQITTSNKSSSPRKRARLESSIPPWIDGNLVHSAESLSDENDTAQVDPRALTAALLDKAAHLAGTVVRKGTVVSVETSIIDQGKTKKVTGVCLSDGSVLSAEKVVFAMGPWSQDVARWFPNSPVISGRRAHSIVFENPRDTQNCSSHIPFSPDALFVSHEGSDEEFEFYPRSNGSLYVCGYADDEPLPASPDLVKSSPTSITSLSEFASRLVPAMGPPRITQACFLPTSESGKPVIGPIPGVSGAFLASGHSCWGILNGPATGLAMSELVLDEMPLSVDTSAFDLG